MTIDEERHRLVWSAENVPMSHYNGSVQVFAEGQGSRVVWIADFLPDEASATIGPMMAEGMDAMKRALGRG